MIIIPSRRESSSRVRSGPSGRTSLSPARQYYDHSHGTSDSESPPESQSLSDSRRWQPGRRLASLSDCDHDTVTIMMNHVVLRDY